MPACSRRSSASPWQLLIGRRQIRRRRSHAGNLGRVTGVGDADADVVGLDEGDELALVDMRDEVTVIVEDHRAVRHLEQLHVAPRAVVRHVRGLDHHGVERIRAARSATSGTCSRELRRRSDLVGDRRHG